MKYEDEDDDDTPFDSVDDPGTIAFVLWQPASKAARIEREVAKFVSDIDKWEADAIAKSNLFVAYMESVKRQEKKREKPQQPHEARSWDMSSRTLFRRLGKNPGDLEKEE